MKNIKNIFKKNQVIIAALAIMIIVAGYLNFTRGKVNEAGNNDIEANANISEEQLELPDGAEVDDNGKVVVDDANIEAENASAEQASKEKEDVKKEDVAKEDDASKKQADASDAKKTAEAGDAEAGEAVLANKGVSSDYFVSNKLKREQTRSKNQETLNAIINNKKISEKEQSEAIQKLIALTDIKEKETVTETLLEAKGFTETLVTINDGKVEVVVNANNLTEQQIAQIEDVVKRKSGISAKNIVITPVKVNSAAGNTEVKQSADDKKADKSEKSEKSE